MTTDTRFVGISTQELIDELARRSHALVISVAFLTDRPGFVDTKTMRKGAWFDCEGLAGALHRHCERASDQANLPQSGNIPGITTPLVTTLQTLGQHPPGRQQ